MKLLIALLILPFLIFIATPSEAQECGVLDLNGKTYDVCERVSSTPIPTRTPTPLPTVTPAPTSTPVPSKPIPSTGKITESGVYSGSRTCTTTSYCVEIAASNVVLRDFHIDSKGGYGIGMWHRTNVRIERGTIISDNSAIAMWDTGGPYYIDSMSITARGNSSTILIADGRKITNGCESLAQKALHHISITNSRIVSNVLSSESVWAKCAQDITITGNIFSGASDWHVSTPDSLRILISNNTFNLTRPENFLGIEVPKAHDVQIVGNDILGGSGDHGVGVNHGSQRLLVANNRLSNMRTVVSTDGSANGSVRDNCLTNVQSVVIGTGLNQSNNGACLTAPPPTIVTPPTTGDGGLK